MVLMFLQWDSSGALYIADYLNNRIQKWIIGESVGKTIADRRMDSPEMIQVIYMDLLVFFLIQMIIYSW